MKQHTELYEVSRDYKRLFDLVNEGHRVACYVDYNDKSKYRDLATYRGVQKYSKTWELTSRGISYTQFDPEIETKDDFIQDCERLNLEFIDQINILNFAEKCKNIFHGGIGTASKFLSKVSDGTVL